MVRVSWCAPFYCVVVEHGILRVEDVLCSDVSDHRCLLSIARFELIGRESIDEVRNIDLGTCSKYTQLKFMKRSKLRLLGHVIYAAHSSTVPCPVFRSCFRVGKAT